MQNRDITAVFTVGHVGANSAINGIKQAGKFDLVKVGGFSMDETILNNIRAGGQIFLTASGFSNGLNFAADIGGLLLAGPRQLNMRKAEQT